MKIKLKTFRQEKPSTCLPACLRIVLHHFSKKLSEKTLARICHTNKEGTTTEEAAAKIRRLGGFEVTEFENADLFEIVDHVARGRPVIVILNTEQEPYGEFSAHAVVVCGFDKNEVKYIDPALGKEMTLDLRTFFNAWSFFDRCGLVIYPKSKPQTRKKRK